MASGSDVQINVDRACDYIAQAAKQQAQLAVLPENFATMGLIPEQIRAHAEHFQTGKIQRQLSAIAKQHKIWVVGGTLPLLGAPQDKIYSSCLVWDPKGELTARYDKIHMFDVTVGSDDQYRESDLVCAGEKIITVDTPFAKLGLAVCYDIRFPELFRALMLKGVEIFILPSAFTIPTGQAHWEILLRARAIENLCYMVASAEVGVRADGRGTYGHSMIIDPWGKIQAQLHEEEGVILTTVEMDKVQKLRQHFPVLTHYRSFVIKESVN